MKKQIVLACVLTLLMTFVCTTASAAVWFGEADSHRLHRDPYCSRRAVEFREPFAHAQTFDSLQSMYSSGDWLPCSWCGGAAVLDPVIPLPESFRLLWNASLAEKALMLPGVWTLPSEEAVPEAVAYAAAKAYVSSVPVFARYLDEVDGQLMCTVSLLHYDACPSGETEYRETYKVLVTTVRWEAVGIVYIDALTGEVYGATLMPDDILLEKNP